MVLGAGTCVCKQTATVQLCSCREPGSGVHGNRQQLSRAIVSLASEWFFAALQRGMSRVEVVCLLIAWLCLA